jgi:hypothetical protein
MHEAAEFVPLKLKTVSNLTHTFEPIKIPPVLKRYEHDADWKYPQLSNKYPRGSTDRETAEKNNLEWVTPGHPLFEAFRRHTYSKALEEFSKGACFYSLQHEMPTRIDFYRARVVDGLGNIAHERVFAVEIDENGDQNLRETGILGNFILSEQPKELPKVAMIHEDSAWLNDKILQPFLEETRNERLSEVNSIAEHVELSLTELLQPACR